MFKKLRSLFEPDDAQRAAEFWRWFAANQHVYRDLPKQAPEELEHSTRILTEHLHRYKDGLFALFGFAQAETDDRYEFVVTAEGDASRFDAVAYLVEAAPEIEGWSIIALKPPIADFVNVRIEDTDYALEELTFALAHVPNEPDATLVHVLFPAPDQEQQADPSSRDQLQIVATLFIEALLGERSFAEDINYVTASYETSDVPLNARRPLARLPLVVEQRVRRN